MYASGLVTEHAIERTIESNATGMVETAADILASKIVQKNSMIQSKNLVGLSVDPSMDMSVLSLGSTPVTPALATMERVGGWRTVSGK